MVFKYVTIQVSICNAMKHSIHGASWMRNAKAQNRIHVLLFWVLKFTSSVKYVYPKKGEKRRKKYYCVE